MTYVYVRLYETTSMTKVHKWTSSSYGDALKLSSPRVDEFIIKSTSGRVYYKVHKWTNSSHGDALKLSSPQMNKLIP